MFSKGQKRHTLNGIWFVSLFAFASCYIGEIPIFKQIGFSVLTIAIILGVIYGNSLYKGIPSEWLPGIKFSQQYILRLGIILYGFRITFQEIIKVGKAGFIVDTIIIFTTFLIGTFIGYKILKLDKDTAMLTAAGSSICGAAAVLATESVLESESYKAAVAVATVVIFGTISMFLYPFLYKFTGMNPESFGIYIGSTVHEVAQVVAAGKSVSDIAMDTAVIVKLTRVMLLAPFLFILGLFIKRKSNKNMKNHIVIPWFALFFIGVAGFNSLHFLPKNIINGINKVDTFLLAMAMAALGMETNLNKIKGVGIKPLIEAFILFVYLVIGGYYLNRFFSI